MRRTRLRLRALMFVLVEDTCSWEDGRMIPSQRFCQFVSFALDFEDFDRLV